MANHTEDENNLWQLRDGSMGDSEPPIVDETTSTDDGKDKADAEGILTGLGNLFAGASLLVGSIDSAANTQDGSTANNTYQPSSNTNTPPPKPKVSPWLIGGGIAIVLLIVGLIMMKKNGGSNSKS
jgi:hypothetical protein